MIKPTDEINKLTCSIHTKISNHIHIMDIYITKKIVQRGCKFDNRGKANG